MTNPTLELSPHKMPSDDMFDCQGCDNCNKDWSTIPDHPSYVNLNNRFPIQFGEDHTIMFLKQIFPQFKMSLTSKWFRSQCNQIFVDDRAQHCGIVLFPSKFHLLNQKVTSDCHKYTNIQLQSYTTPYLLVETDGFTMPFDPTFRTVVISDTSQTSAYSFVMLKIYEGETTATLIDNTKYPLDCNKITKSPLIKYDSILLK